MCFSPQVDLVAGAVIAVVAVDALRHNRSVRTAPLALMPAVFAVHTLVSAVVWWGLVGEVPAAVGEAATAVYLAIAFVLWPVYVPFAVLAVEPHGWRRPALVALALLGLYSSGEFLRGLLAGLGDSVACTYYIDFSIGGVSTAAAAIYVLATCGALLVSSDRRLATWGVLNLLAVVALAILVGRGLPSLWCFWAACTSVFIAWWLRRGPPQVAPGRDDLTSRPKALV